MDVRDLVKQHYGAAELSEAILAALAEADTDVEHLEATDVFPLDQLHAGGVAATRHLLERLGIGPGMRVLDVGCGIGGPARLAASYGAAVTGVDLTPEFVDTATALSERLGLAEQVRFLVSAGESLPFEDGSFDAAYMVHVGMNVPAKQSVFEEVRRVVAPGGLFGLYEQMRTGEGAVRYPMPWAEDERSSFVETVEDYRAHLEAAGFTVEAVEDRTDATRGPSTTGRVSPVLLFGPAFAERIGHNVAATEAGDLGAFEVVARA